MNKLIRKFAKSEEGVTALEYGLIAGVIALAIVGGATSLGTGISGFFTHIAHYINGITVPS